MVESSWCANSTKIRETGFDTVKSQQGYAALFQIAFNITVGYFFEALMRHGPHVQEMTPVLLLMQLRENWVNDMRIYPESAPVWARLPLGNLTGYQATLEVRSVAALASF